MKECVGRGNGLRCLAQPHVVGEQQSTLREEALHGLVLIGIEALPQAPEGLAALALPLAAFGAEREGIALGGEQRLKGGLDRRDTAPAAAPVEAEEASHESQALGGALEGRVVECPDLAVASLPEVAAQRVQSRGQRSALLLARGRNRDPHACEPVPGSAQRAHRVPEQPRYPGAGGGA